MKVLRKTLIRKWFDMIASGEKKEEYLEIKDYWVSRLMENNTGFSIHGCGPNAASLFAYAKGLTGSRSKAVIYLLENGITFKEFDIVSANNGYAKNCPNVQWEHLGTRIGQGKPQWGAVPGNIYFILEIGRVNPTPIS